MPTQDSAPIGAPCWVDLMTTDTDGARAFYGAVFGWESDEPAEEFGGYFNFTKDGVRIAGGMANPEPAQMPNMWSVYLTTDDARKTIETANANGGQTFVEATDIGDLGTMGVVGDSGGAAIGLWQPGEFNGFGIQGEPGTPSWFELFTRDHAAAVRFYRDVFRWDTEAVSDTPEFRYTVLKHGENQLAGIMDASSFLPEGVAAHWSVYFGAASTDASLAKIVELGGSIVQPAEDTPYGRLAVAADPTGATFKLVQPPA